MYTGVPHFDRRIFDADIMLLSPKSVICCTTRFGVSSLRQSTPNDVNARTLMLVSLSFSQRMFSGFRSLCPSCRGQIFALVG